MNIKSAKIEDLLNLSLKQIQAFSKQDKIIALEKLVKYHNKKYFIANDPVVSDEYFDQITEELKKLDPNNPALFEIVGDIGDVVHPQPMLSIDKAYTYESIVKWVNDTNDKTYLVEPKYDGMAARYQNGVLSTRGNGLVGEDISARLSDLKIIGGKLPTDNTSVYGEIVIPTEFFNKNLAGVYKNSRNAVVGIVKAKVVKPEGINALLAGGVHFVIHDSAFVQKVTKSELLNETRWEEILEEAFHSPYPLDGVVIKVTNDSIKQNLGATAHHEKWQIAYKTPAEKKWSTVVGITDQVGRTGRITSVAHIKPIELSGATVTNVTLHNFDYIKQIKIGVGSKVEVMRSGEVIPFITNVKPSKSSHKPPKKCPVCGGSVQKDGKYLQCVNPDCPAKISQSIEHYFKKLGVEELGIKTVERFINEFGLTGIIDFYNLTIKKIAPLEGYGEKSGKNIVTNIQNTLNKTITPVQLVSALGIKEVGNTTAKLIISEYGFDSLPNLTQEELLSVKGIGPSIAQSFVSEIKQKWKIVQSLQSRGLQFKQSSSNKLAGLTFCVTGKKEKYSRDELIEFINQNGGEYKSSVTKDLNYLIAGEGAGSKLTKAQSLGVKVITEQKFLKLL
jgi:DNA ligase (NAD+)